MKIFAFIKRHLNCLLAFLVFLECVSCKHEINVSNPKEKLGHYLFFETQLSLNNTKSCASCHNPNFAFTDGYRTSGTALGENTKHNAPSLINASAMKFFDWASPNTKTLEQQIQRPLFSHSPIELGLDVEFKTVQTKLQNDSNYIKLFTQAFGLQPQFSQQEIVACLVAYTKSLNALGSKYDRQINQFSASEKNGMKLFMSAKLQCSSCHMPPYFTIATQTTNIDSAYANNGLYIQYPTTDLGIFEKTKIENDKGKFKIPSLRNVILTAPYMHDGSMATIEEVIDFYAEGGKNIENKLFNLQKDKRITGFEISSSEKKDLIHFLQTLTDTSFISNSHFQNPFQNK